MGNSIQILGNCKMVHFLENIGREAHTYLYHICNNYRLLSDVTVFVQAMCTKMTPLLPLMCLWEHAR
jgi:Protein of unknown function (DUF3431)